MLAAHAAFRRDLTQLARAAAFADLPDPARRASVRAGWELFKRQLHLHHTAEDEIVWPALRERLPNRDHAQSVLDAMEAEHQQIDPLLAAVDDAFARADHGHRADVRAIGDAADALASSLTGHLAHEERDGLPLIGVALSSAEWRAVGFRIVAQERAVGRRRDVRLAGRRRATRTRPPPRSARCRRPRGWSTARSGGRATPGPARW